MKLHFYQSRTGNFGDDLNLWLWDHLLPGWREAWPDWTLVGVGTLINDQLPPGPKLVVGSGVGYLRPGAAVGTAGCRFEAVRGPRSAAALGLDPGRGILDPAALIPLIAGAITPRRHGETLFIPHHNSISGQDWPAICRSAGITYLSPQGPSSQVIADIAGSGLVITESMHGAILADAYGVPWIAVRVGPQFNAGKWADWSEALGFTAHITTLETPGTDLRKSLRRSRRPAGPQVRPGDAPARRAEPATGFTARLRRRWDAWALARQLRRLSAGPGQLSDRAALADAQQRLLRLIEELRAGFGGPPPSLP